MVLVPDVSVSWTKTLLKMSFIDEFLRKKTWGLLNGGKRKENCRRIRKIQEGIIAMKMKKGQAHFIRDEVGEMGTIKE